ADQGAAAAPSDAEVEEIVVTGIRGTLTSARELKRNSGQIQESIVAEDIGKLPDTSIASTLQRIPGIQLARDTRGQGNTYVVHGLKQVTTTIDGRQIFSSTNRAANLLELSADILSGIDVYKTATADQIEGGLGGLINIHSAQPFNFDGLHVAGTLSGYYSDINDKLTPRASLVLSNRFDTGIGEIGVLVGGQFERVFSGGYQTSTNAYSDNRNLFDRDGDGVFPNDAGDVVTLPSQVRGRYETGRLTRSSVYGAIQWRPVEELTLYANAMRFNTKSTSATQQLSVQTDGAQGVGSSFQFKDGNPNIPDSYTLTNALIRSSRGASDFNQHTNS
ncbi:MAG: TonB-dependent receptor, partial [Stutzerimonas stutzeri]